MLAKQKLTQKIQEFAHKISSEPLCQADHQPEEEARPSSCFHNVWAKVDKDGGAILFGWIFGCRVNPNYGDYLVATHHAVWCAPDKILIDITPFTNSHHPCVSGNNVIFLVNELALPVECKNLLVDGERMNLIAPRPSKYFALNDSHELKEYVNKLAEKEQKACQEIYEGKVNPAQIPGTVFFS
jgi:hypothetical protein